MGIFIGLVALVLLALAAFLAVALRSWLTHERREGTLPGQEDDRRPEHLAVGTPEQLDDMQAGERFRRSDGARDHDPSTGVPRQAAR